MQHFPECFLQQTPGQACIYNNHISRDLIWLQIVPRINGAHNAVSCWNKAKNAKNPSWTAAVRLTVSKAAPCFARHMSLCRCTCDHFLKGRTGRSGFLSQSLFLPHWLTHQEAEGLSLHLPHGSAMQSLTSKPAVSSLQFNSLTNCHLIISQFLILGHSGKPKSAPAACSLNI